MRHRAWIVVIGVLLFVAAQVAFALPLNPGDTLYKPIVLPPPNYTAGLPAYFTGANLVASLTSPIVPAVGDIEGTVTSYVYQNPGDGNTLTFAYLIDRTADVDDSTYLDRMTFNGIGWAAADIEDAGSDASGTSTASPNAPNWTDGDPYFLQRDIAALGAGINVQFDVGGAGTLIGPGDKSAIFWFDTNSIGTPTITVAAFIDSAAISSADILAPPTSLPVPEPATLSLVALGVAGLMGRRLRSR